MKISRKELKEIIKEHLDEGMFDWVPPLAAKKRSPEKKWSAEDEWSEAVGAMSEKVMPALWGTYDNPPHPELLKKGQDLMAGMKAAGPKQAMNENLAEIRNITDLKNLFNARSQGGTVAVEFTTTEVDDALRELERAIGWLRMFRLADDTPVKELKET